MADGGRDRRERVAEFESLAETNLPTLRNYVSELETYLSADDDVRGRAVRVVVALSEEYPETVETLVDPLADCLADGTFQVDAARALENVAAEQPSAVEDSLAALVAVLGEDGPVLIHATGALAAMADSDPEMLAQPGILDRLFDLLDAEQPTVRANATRIVSEIAAVDATPVCERVAAIRGRLRDTQAPVRRRAASALGNVATTCPDAVIAAVPDLVDLFDDPDPSVRAAGAAALGYVARQPNEGVQETVDALLAAIHDDADPVRQHATFALAHLAAEYPNAVRPGVEDLARRLVDDAAPVRRNARSALERLEADYSAVVTDARDDIESQLETLHDDEQIRFTEAELRGLATDERASSALQAAAHRAVTAVESGGVTPATTTEAATTTAASSDEQQPDETDVLFCPDCGEQLDDGGTFCPVCGTELG